MQRHTFWLITTLALLLAACSSHRYTVVEPPASPLTEFKVLEIPMFSSNLTSAEAQELARAFSSRLMREIADYRARHPEDVVYEQIVQQTSSEHDVLVMKGTVLSYEEGSRAKRYWIGLGSGKAYCTIRVEFFDKESGKSLATTTFDGELTGGVFGGSADEAVEGVVKAFLDFMDAYMERA